jgi:hypothetical protein
MEVIYNRHPIYTNYFASNTGKVFSLAYGWSEKAQVRHRKGYMYCSIWHNNKEYKKSVHAMVVETFIGTPEKGYEINHKDRVKENNSLDNLEVVTLLYNKRHSYFGKKRFVTQHRDTKRYSVKIKDNKKLLYTPGDYNTKEEAYERAYTEYLNHFGIEPWSK